MSVYAQNIICLCLIFQCALNIISEGVDPSSQNTTISSASPVNASSESKTSPIPSTTTTIHTPTTSPVPPPDTTYKFEKEEYHIKLYKDQSGVIEQFRVTPNTINITYEIKIDDEMKTKLSNILDLDATIGVLRMNQPLPSGEYSFSIQARLGTKIMITKVKITVSEIATCTDNKGEAHFPYAFLKKHITEHTNSIIFAGNAGDGKKKCEYSLLNKNPAADYFELNKTTGELKVNDKIDRENEAIFKNQIQPHFNVDIVVKCTPVPARTKRSRNDNDMEHLDTFEETDLVIGMTHISMNHMKGNKEIINNENYSIAKRSLRSDVKNNSVNGNTTDNETSCGKKKSGAACDSIIGDEIIYNTQNMELLILIDDANDNAPEFNKKEYFFGYPEKILFRDVIPENLGTVLATDKDEGLNSMIKYMINQTEEVTIDPCTGILYPHYAHFSYKRFKFEVTATDSNGRPDGLKKTVPVTVQPLQGHHIMKVLVKKYVSQSNNEIINIIEDCIQANVSILREASLPSMEELSGSIELKTYDYDVLAYLVIYAYNNKSELIDMNTIEETIRDDTNIKERIVWTHVLSGSPYHYVKSKGFISSVVVIMLLLCVASLVFYVAYIRTGRYYKCLNYFKTTNTTTPLERDQCSIGTSDYVVSFARMSHDNPTFNIVDSESTKDNMFTPVALKAYENPTNQIINADELVPAPTILVNSNSNSRRNSYGGEDNMGLSVGNETRARRKSSVSFNEIVEQYHTVH